MDFEFVYGEIKPSAISRLAFKWQEPRARDCGDADSWLAGEEHRPGSCLEHSAAPLASPRSDGASQTLLSASALSRLGSRGNPFTPSVQKGKLRHGAIRRTHAEQQVGKRCVRVVGRTQGKHQILLPGCCRARGKALSPSCKPVLGHHQGPLQSPAGAAGPRRALRVP